MSYQRRDPRPVESLGSTDYHDGKIPASPPAVPGTYWNNPSFTWYGDPLGVNERRYLADRAAYWKITKDVRAAEVKADAKMAGERGIAVPPPLTAAQLPAALVLKVKTLAGESPLKTVAVVGALGAIGYFIWRKTK